MEVGLGWWLAGLVAVLWATTWFFARLRARSRLRAHHGRGLRARQGEAEAASLLEAEGFNILGAQVQGKWDVWVDGEAHQVEVFADYLVQQDGLTFVAEVKTGERAPRIETAATRRQMLEYLFVFGADGVLLVDMEVCRVRVVQFEIGVTRQGD